MSQNSPILDLPFLQPSQAQKHVSHNEALRRLDMIVQLHVLQTGATIPPDDAKEGDIYGLGTAATNAWAGQDGMLAAWLDSAWHFFEPRVGWRAWDASTDQLVVWSGGTWSTPRPDLNNLDGVGIGTGFDSNNRLAVQAPATLLSHDGQGHQLKVNKAAETDTASLLFQSGWTGFAEIGLAGGNVLSVKVSEDGSTWTEALHLDGATGHASGSAIQAGPADATVGRLMVTGAFGLGETGTGPLIQDINATGTPTGTYRYQSGTSGTNSFPDALKNSNGIIRIERYNSALLRQTAWRNTFEHGIWTRENFGGSWGAWRHIYDQTTILGPVSESAGQPTGAIIERGSSLDGEFIRFADGTQICTRFFQTESTSHVWTFPAAFALNAPVSLQALARHATAPRIVTENGDLAASSVTLNVWDSTGTAAPAAVHTTATGRWF